MDANNNNTVRDTKTSYGRKKITSVELKTMTVLPHPFSTHRVDRCELRKAASQPAQIHSLHHIAYAF